jgi:integrase
LLLQEHFAGTNTGTIFYGENMPITITHAHAQKVTTPCRIYDTQRGLQLWVKSAKAKYWLVRASHGGKRIELSLGRFPLITVQEARQKAAELYAMLAKGINPLAQRQAAKKVLSDEPKVNFAEFAAIYIRSQRPSWRNAKHADQWVNTIETFANPIIGKKDPSDITVEDILKILTPIWQTKTETATRLRGRLEKILSAASVKGLRHGANPSVWRGQLEFLLPKPERLKRVVHHPALPYKDLPAFVKELQARNCVAALALEFCILTASRTGEVIYGKWEEINSDIWTIPGERMKVGKTHQVPLGGRCMEILREAKQLAPYSPYIFSRGQNPLSNMAMLKLLKRMDRSDITVHGFRSTFRDWVAEETNHPSDVAEMALAHTVENKVIGAYKRGNLLEKRRRLANEWEDYCCDNHKSNVVAIRAG